MSNESAPLSYYVRGYLEPMLLRIIERELEPGELERGDFPICRVVKSSHVEYVKSVMNHYYTRHSSEVFANVAFGNWPKNATFVELFVLAVNRCMNSEMVLYDITWQIAMERVVRRDAVYVERNFRAPMTTAKPAVAALADVSPKPAAIENKPAIVPKPVAASKPPPLKLAAPEATPPVPKPVVDAPAPVVETPAAAPSEPKKIVRRIVKK